MQKIENERFIAEINERGAELTHLVNKSGNFDYIWNDDLWPKHAPVLFPAIGRSENDAYYYQGKEYEMPQHGFAADQVFEIEDNDGIKLTLKLNANEATRRFYPFDFTLFVTFELTDEGLVLSFKIENQTAEQLSFSIGSHPAFNLPINGEGEFEDYTVTFEPSNLDLKQYKIVKTPNPYRSGDVIDLKAAKGSQIALNYEMFDDGLIIIQNDGIKGVLISSPKTKHQIHVSLDDFRYVCLWTKEGANAKFLCVEPFQGLPDVAGHEVELLEKEANSILDPGKTREFSYDITLK
ncbi:aldose 1-epimerase family protein [Secundilactobacillus kimchicus]|uniref:Aldose 1-epimerase n=1 Tax=Secundilactobacillus kimchicus JCM 15530 TaxID=1302272 RepID=A0A0R1HPD1_9LACO|nr:aldose 1-epimerase family protein [Secundilactobacillus kimchicus]KRK48312.1 hypothetical protein FC96_GL001412 [Secundilactobacillus kimchicus JCM 15530]MBT9671078.1 aldose 1-epimerase family protein [Secundilactobacillus kimchicus]